MVARRTLTIAAALPIALVLAGSLSACSPLSLFASWGGTPAPSHRATHGLEAGPTELPSPVPTLSSNPTPGCVDRVISAPGTYRLDYCENLTVTGSGIIVTASHLGTLTVIGNSLQVYAQEIGALDVKGDLNHIETTDDLRLLRLTGDRNLIACHGSMTSATVTGDDNAVRVDGGIDGDVQNNGQRNEIGGEP